MPNEKQPPAAEMTELQKDIELARQMQAAERKNAPNVSVNPAFHDPRDVQCRRLLPEAYGKSANQKCTHTIQGGAGSTVDVFYGNAEDKRRDILAGWEPVQDQPGMQAQQGGQLLYKRPKDIGDVTRKMDRQTSRNRLRSKDKDRADNNMISAYDRKEREQTTVG